MTENELVPDELAEQEAELLPEREAMSVLDPVPGNSFVDLELEGGDDTADDPVDW